MPESVAIKLWRTKIEQNQSLLKCFKAEKVANTDIKNLLKTNRIMNQAFDLGISRFSLLNLFTL